jgi:hypothetical protein
MGRREIMIRGRVAILVALAFGFAATSVFAAPLLPGTSANAAAEVEPLGGATVAGPMVSPLAGAAFTATITSTVISGDTANPYGGLTFVYVVTNNDTSVDAIGRTTLNGFTGFQTDASFSTLTLGTAPATMDRSANGNVVGFSFVGPPLGPAVLVPGATSMTLVVQTDAKAFTTSIGNVIDGSIASGPIYAPAVPEPASILLVLGGLGYFWRRR